MAGRPRSPEGGTTLRVEVPESARGERLDVALAALLPGESRTSLQRLMRGGRVLLLGRPARPSYTVRGGERVEIDVPPPLSSALEPRALPLTILHEDADLIVVDKPAGLAVHPGAGAPRATLVNALLHHCRDLSGVGGVERPGIVHRLDQATSGVLVVAKNDAAHRALAAQFKARSVRKVYEALVWGVPRRPSGLIEAPIGRHASARVRMTVRPDGRAARTHYEVRATLGPLALLELRPETGRTHQIRVHLSFIGHPIVGDRLYGGLARSHRTAARVQNALAPYGGLALHARRLAFAHPRGGAWREFAAPLPEDFRSLIQRLGEAMRREGPVSGEQA